MPRESSILGKVLIRIVSPTIVVLIDDETLLGVA